MNKCIDCAHWESKIGGEDWQGHCVLRSCECANAIFNHKPPTRFLKIDEVQPEMRKRRK